METFKLNGLVTERVINRMFTMCNIKKYNKLTRNKTLYNIYTINHKSNIFMIDLIWPLELISRYLNKTTTTFSIDHCNKLHSRYHDYVLR